MFSVFCLAFRKYWESRHLWNRLKRNQLCDGRYDELHFSPGEGGLLIRHLQVCIVRELDPLAVLVHVVKFERVATLASLFQHACSEKNQVCEGLHRWDPFNRDRIRLLEL